MSGVAPEALGSRARASARGAGLWWATAILLAAVLVQVSLMPFLRIADGVPDIVAPTVVAIALLRGPLVGAVAGFAGGLAVELTAPVETLGVLALAYLVVGGFCGRYCEARESASLVAPLTLSVAAAAAVQLGYALFQVLLGRSMPPSEFVAEVMIPTAALTALLSPPVLLVVRRLLGEPRVVEPYAVPG